MKSSANCIVAILFMVLTVLGITLIANWMDESYERTAINILLYAAIISFLNED